jgi:hypothetical protein
MSLPFHFIYFIHFFFYFSPIFYPFFVPIFCSVTVLLARKRRIDSVIKAVIDFDSNCPEPTTTLAKYQALLEFFLLKNTKCVRFNVEGSQKTNNKLFEFVTSYYSKKYAVYIHAFQNVGKSHSLYKVVYRLCKSIKNRIIFIFNCSAWSSVSTGGESLKMLIDTVLLGFPQDPSVMQHCNDVSLNNTSI